MNVFDVLREKLEEAKSDWNVDYNTPIVKSIEIVNQVEQKYNNGWIPCSERLPEECKCKDGNIDPSEEVLVYIYYGENCVNNGCGVSRYWSASKHYANPWIDLTRGKENVIA